MAKPLTVHSSSEDKTIFGFWVYLMSDCLLFGTFFAIYIVLHNNTNGGPSGRELFSLPSALAETLLLLTSSFTCALANLAAQRNDKNKVIAAFAVTFLLGIAFLTLELSEFKRFIGQGDSWQRSGFLSSFFSLVGLHGLHIATGLLWMVILLVPVFWQGLTPVNLKRLKCLRLFWHFLDVVWVFIFTIVYLYPSNLQSRPLGGIESCPKSILAKGVGIDNTTPFARIDFGRFEPTYRPTFEVTWV